MNLYRFILTTNAQDFSAVAVAENEDQAFQIIEREIQHHFLKKIRARDLALVEKKQIGAKGAGYLLSPRRDYE
ncbi:DUF3906 family protein [Sporolactobacillus spathodeae]|uniref:DUF3906 family protein n=1 Tax=Sporolactobacillus spathodeae TaxID=1465502 RepID=A0ABS2QAI8_9BACL|nr:DUF3906 family protein [Sporolactobacillus spathodeae]MBM7658738.1 hypothetical protein [Sporolactobacillus spathodeae]